MIDDEFVVAITGILSSVMPSHDILRYLNACFTEQVKFAFFMEVE